MYLAFLREEQILVLVFNLKQIFLALVIFLPLLVSHVTIESIFLCVKKNQDHFCPHSIGASKD
jgi:hypothetical protein